MSERAAYLVILILYIITFCSHVQAVLASRSPGGTYPNRIEIQIGDSANITCHINLHVFQGDDSTSMHFVEQDTGQEVSRNDIVFIDDSTIVYMLRNAEPQNRNYLCKSGDNGIGLTYVSVGTPPLNIVDFQCRGHDFTYIVCNFTRPENMILTQYNLTYTTKFPNYLHECTLEMLETQGVCNLTLDKGNYRPSYEVYNFTLTGYNTLGTNVQSFLINHYESVIPARPDYHFDQITTNSVMLTWQMLRYSHYKGLLYEIRVGPQNFELLNWSDYDKRVNKSEYKLKLRNLPYAYWNYTVSLRIKLKMSRNDDTMWSEACVQSFQTKSRIPDDPPTTDVGSFYIDPTETQVRLYWQQLPTYRQNGANFKYIVKQVEKDGVLINLTATEIDHTSAVFLWHKDHDYKFTIKSRNDEGESLQSRQIIVPALSKINERKSPKWIRNIYHGANSTYTLSWSPPEDPDNLQDYTVFWCHSKRAIRNQCKNSLQFKHINKTTTKFSTEVQDQMQNLAVSANYVNFSSGMHWTMCTADVTSDLVKLEPEITVTSRTINMQWSPDRICPSLLEGYNLTYCRVEDAVYATNVTVASMKCDDKATSLIIEKTERKFTLWNLTPFTTYKIEMFMFSKLKEGRVSDAQFKKTKEEAPSPPRNLKFKNITSNSVCLSWDPPANINGILRFYTIWLLGKKTEQYIVNCSESVSVGVSKCNKSNDAQINFWLQNLNSFTNYQAYVIGHTVDKSDHSNYINFTTLIGKPSKPRYMVESLKSGNLPTVMQWSEPESPAGRVEFYEVEFATWHENVLLRKRISGVVGSTSCVISKPLCIDSEYEHKLHVRAVNVATLPNEIDDLLFAPNSTIEDDDAYEGNDDLKCVGTTLPEMQQLNVFMRYRRQLLITSDWEKGPVYVCAATTKLSRITLFALLILVAVITASYFVRVKFTQMADIKCELPSDFAIAPAVSNSKRKVTSGVENQIIGKDEGNGYCKELFNNNENRRLLSSVSNDSDYIRSTLNLRDVSTSSMDKSSGYCGSTNNKEDNTSQLETVASKVEPNGFANADTSYMVMNMLKQHGKKSPQVQGIPENPSLSSNVYVHPDGRAISTIAQHSSPNLSCVRTNSSYIKPNSLMVWPGETNTNTTCNSSTNAMQYPVNCNGYVAPQDLQKSMEQKVNCDGYTTIEALGKSTLDAPSQVIMRRDNIAENLERPMPPTGYVTQKELSVFGQHRSS